MLGRYKKVLRVCARGRESAPIERTNAKQKSRKPLFSRHTELRAKDQAGPIPPSALSYMEQHFSKRPQAIKDGCGRTSLFREILFSGNTPKLLCSRSAFHHHDPQTWHAGPTSHPNPSPHPGLPQAFEYPTLKFLTTLDACMHPAIRHATRSSNLESISNSPPTDRFERIAHR